MATAEENSLLSQLLSPVTECLTPEVARRIAALKASPQLQARVDNLAGKANAGTLTAKERSDYEQYVRFWQFVSLLQIKARDLLDELPESA